MAAQDTTPHHCMDVFLGTTNPPAVQDTKKDNGDFLRQCLICFDIWTVPAHLRVRNISFDDIVPAELLMSVEDLEAEEQAAQQTSTVMQKMVKALNKVKIIAWMANKKE